MIVELVEKPNKIGHINYCIQSYPVCPQQYNSHNQFTSIVLHIHIQYHYITHTHSAQRYLVGIKPQENKQAS